MKRLIAAFALILGACAAPGPDTSSGPKGWVVLSVLVEQTYSPAILNIRPVGASDGGGMGVTMMDAFKMHKFGETWGVVKAAQYPPGTYEIFNFYLDSASTKKSYRSRQDFALRFEVKPNEVVYLGEFVVTRTRVKSLVEWISGPTPYFIRADHRERDIALAAKEVPELQGLPSRTAALTPEKPTPFIRASRVE